MPPLANAVLLLVALTFFPGLELRASIPVGFFTPAVRDALGLPAVVALCLATNILVGILVFWLLGPAERLARKWTWFDRKVWPWIARKQEKLRPYVEKYGEWGIALFIGVPLPGTGAYSGAIGAYLLKLNPKKFWVANALGVLIACVAVTLICVLVDRGAVADDSLLRRLFLKNVNL